MTFIQGAFILTLTNLLTGILAFVYRIYLTRSIGSEGIGLYQLIIPLYYLMITLVSGGITTAISKLASEQHAKGKYKNIFKIIRICGIVVTFWSIVISLIVGINAEYLSLYILKDSRTVFSIIVLAPAIIFISASAVLKGYFYGLQNVQPPATIDVIEKVIRLSVLIAITSYLMPYGIEYICAGAMIAMTLGELTSLILLVFAYKKNKLPITSTDKTDVSSGVIFSVIKLALPLSISGALNTIMDMIIAIMIPAQLVQAGYSHERALSLYGELTGMVIPLVFFPFIIVASLGVTLVPSIAASYTRKNWVALNKKCNDAHKITTVLAIFMTVIFMVFPLEICETFFKCPQAAPLLFWISLGCLFEYWQFILFSIMNSVNLQNYVFQNSLLNIAITIACIYILTPIPGIGIYGYIIGFNVSSLIVVVSNVWILKKKSHIHIKYFENVSTPIVSMCATVFCLFYLNTLSINFIYKAAASMLIYLVLLMLTRTFTISQIKNTFKFN